MGAGAIPIQIEKAFKERAKGKHKLQVFTADIDYEGDDCIDVSLQGGYSFLVPPKHLLINYKLGKSKEDQFQKAYFKFLENSFIQYQHTWDDILDRRKVVLVCSCNVVDKTCQRHFLIKFLKKFGAVYKGKLKP
jgi:hypothetical protein